MTSPIAYTLALVSAFVRTGAASRTRAYDAQLSRGTRSAISDAEPSARDPHVDRQDLLEDEQGDERQDGDVDDGVRGAGARSTTGRGIGRGRRRRRAGGGASSLSDDSPAPRGVGSGGTRSTREEASGRIRRRRRSGWEEKGDSTSCRRCPRRPAPAAAYEDQDDEDNYENASCADGDDARISSDSSSMDDECFLFLGEVAADALPGTGAGDRFGSTMVGLLGDVRMGIIDNFCKTRARCHEANEQRERPSKNLPRRNMYKCTDSNKTTSLAMPKRRQRLQPDSPLARTTYLPPHQLAGVR